MLKFDSFADVSHVMHIYNSGKIKQSSKMGKIIINFVKVLKIILAKWCINSERIFQHVTLEQVKVDDSSCSRTK